MYTVLIAAPAEADLREQHDWWAEHRSVEQAARWYTGILRATLKLETSPETWPLIPDPGPWPAAFRQMTFGLGRKPTHRAVFTI